MSPCTKQEKVSRILAVLRGSRPYCFVQGIIPYGAQLLLASKLSGVSPMDIIPNLYYPFIMGGCALLSILLRYPRRYSR